ncbi:MAG: hypothetical protein EXR49_06185 [Dehalococcoidia bacterium]|nr:hypothetical protein [Dehalococcoidia bacterium]
MTTHEREPDLNPRTILAQLKKNGVTHVVYLPDTESSGLYQAMLADGTVEVIPITREGEALGIAAGLYAGGKTPVCVIQNTGLFESGDSIRGLGLECNLPIVMLIGYRGWTRRGPTPDSAGRHTEPMLQAWGLSYYLVETDADTERISLAFRDAPAARKPVVVLIGGEYAA